MLVVPWQHYKQPHLYGLSHDNTINRLTFAGCPVATQCRALSLLRSLSIPLKSFPFFGCPVETLSTALCPVTTRYTASPLLGSSLGRWSAMSATMVASSRLSFSTLATSSLLKLGRPVLDRTIWKIIDHERKQKSNNKKHYWFTMYGTETLCCLRRFPCENKV